MNARRRFRGTPAALTMLLALASLALPPAEARAPSSVRHPHFQKRLEARVSKDAVLTATYQTVTFDAEAAEKMAVGSAWHLANSHLEFTVPMRIGGHEFEAGRYALKAKKQEGDAWSLVLDAPGRFAAKLSDKAVELATDFDGEAPLFEHLSVDIHPTGDKESTTLNLEVRFDRKCARARIELRED